MVRQPLQRAVSAFGPWQRSWQAGQMYMQAPHSRQTSERMSKGVEIFLLWPRCWKPIAAASICSAQIRVHRPQRTHSSLRGVKRTRVTPNCEAMSWRTLEPGAMASMSSIIIRRDAQTLFVSVRTTSPSSAG